LTSTGAEDFAMKVLFILLMALVIPIRSTHAQMPPGTTWYWQLSGKIDTSHSGSRVYDIDLEDSSAALIANLHRDGHKVICYFSAGTYEPGRADASKFPKVAIGTKLKGWPEYYVDIRNATIRQIMQARMDAAKAKMCDGFEPDVLDAFENPSGFHITTQDEVDYIHFLAAEGHKRNLLVALKNDPEIVPLVVDAVDFAIAEQCVQYNECSSYTPFIKQGKAVLSAEYSSYSAAKCAKAKSLGFSLVFYNLNLNGRKFIPCP
jgi:hypothetical protein